MPRLRLSLAVLAATALAASMFVAAAAQAAVPDKWIRWGAVPRDATIRSLDFLTPVQLFAAGESEGVFASTNALGPWTLANGGLDSVPGGKDVRQVVAGKDGNVYAATSAGLFRSPAGLGGWSQVGGGPGERKLNQGGVQSIVFNTPLDMVVAVAGAAPNGIFYSADGGSTWDRAGGLPAVESVYHLTTGPLGVPIYAAADDGVFASLDGGRSWALTSDGIPPSETVFRVAVADVNTLYAGTGSEVYKSVGAGLTWNEAMGSEGKTLPYSGTKRGFLLTPSLGGLFGPGRGTVGTSQGAYATIDGGRHWGRMAVDTLTPDAGTPMGDRIVESMGVGFLPPVLMAGTRGFGVFSLPMTPVSAPGSLSVSPSSGLNAGDTLSVSVAGFAGSAPIFFTYKWKKCTSGASCTPTTAIPGATAATYTIPESDTGANTRYAVDVTAANLPNPNQVTKTSAPTTAGVAGLPGDAPMPKLIGGPSLSPSQGTVPTPVWGQVYTINNGAWRTGNVATVVPSSFAYQWRRCKSGNCSPIAGQTKSTYTTTPDDVGATVQGWIRATANAVSGELYLAGESPTLIERKPVNTEKPRVVGDAYTGRTLSSSVGAWTANKPSFARRWFRCEEDGLGCNPITGATASTYTVTAQDLGKRLEVEITATVQDPNQNRVDVAYSDPTAVITDPPVVAGSGGSGGAGGGGATGGGGPSGAGADTMAPVIGAARLASSKLTARHPLALTIASSEPATARIAIQRLLAGRKVKGRCRKATRANRRRPRCTRAVAVATITRPVGAGTATVTITTRIGRRTLPLGRYRAVIMLVDGAGNASAPRTVTFRVARR